MLMINLQYLTIKIFYLDMLQLSLLVNRAFSEKSVLLLNIVTLQLLNIQL